MKNRTVLDLFLFYSFSRLCREIKRLSNGLSLLSISFITPYQKIDSKKLSFKVINESQRNGEMCSDVNVLSLKLILQLSTLQSLLFIQFSIE